MEAEKTVHPLTPSVDLGPVDLLTKYQESPEFCGDEWRNAVLAVLLEDYLRRARFERNLRDDARR